MIVNIEFNLKTNDELTVKLTGTGPEIPKTLPSDIKQGNKIKKDTEIAGLYLVYKVIKLLNHENQIEISMSETALCENCGIYNNTVTLTLKVPHVNE